MPVAHCGVIQIGEGVDERGQADGDQKRAEHIEALRLLMPALRHEAHRTEQGEGGNRHIDEEHPAPIEIFGEHAAEDEAEGGTAGGNRRPDAEGPVAFLAFGKDDREDRQRRRRHHRTASALHGARGDEQAKVIGKPADNEAMPNRISPAMKMVRRPIRSASLPPSSRKPPKVSA